MLGWGLSFSRRAISRIFVHVTRLVAAGVKGQAVVWWYMWAAGWQRPRPRALLDAVLFLVYAAGLILAIPLCSLRP